MHERPLSPHLQIYRLPVTAWLSITHRVTGVLLILGMLVLVTCLMNTAGGPSTYAGVQHFLQSLPGRTLLWGWIFSLLFHLCHGIRHLLWDAGWGLRKETLRRQAVLELGAVALLTCAVFFLS